MPACPVAEKKKGTGYISDWVRRKCSLSLLLAWCVGHQLPLEPRPEELPPPKELRLLEDELLDRVSRAVCRW